MKKYESYKKVELPWLNEIPNHWDVEPVSHIFEERREKNSNYQTKFILSVMKDRGVIPYSEKGNVGNKSSEDISKYKIVYPDDLVLNSMNMMIGSLGKSEYMGALSQVYYVLKLMNPINYDMNYLTYVFSNKNFYESLKILGKGILEHRLRVPMDKLKCERLPIPPLEEQKKIADYLDWKINEIDKLISIENEKVKQLEICKQKYIDSLIDSIHCELKSLKYIFDFGKGLNITKENLGKNGDRCISYGEIHNDFSFSFSSCNPKLRGLEKIDRIIITKFANLRKNDFIFADTSEDLIGCGNFTFLEDDNRKVYAGYHTVVAKPILKFNSKYMAYHLQSNEWRNQIRESVRGIKVYSITQSILKSSKVKLPDIEIQNNISNKADKFIEVVNKLIPILNKKIQNLSLLKQSLISEVVTGKIDVRDVVIPKYEKAKANDNEEINEMESVEIGN